MSLKVHTEKRNFKRGKFYNGYFFPLEFLFLIFHLFYCQISAIFILTTCSQNFKFILVCEIRKYSHFSYFSHLQNWDTAGEQKNMLYILAHCIQVDLTSETKGTDLDLNH